MADEPLNPYEPPSVAQTERGVVETPVVRDGPRGIGGWLLVSLIGLIVVGLMCLVALVRMTMELDLWLEQLYRLDVALHFFGLWMLYAAVLGGAALGVAWMIRGDRQLPKLMITFYVLQAILWIVIILANDEPAVGTSAYRAGRVFGLWFWPGRCVLWIAYYLRSERVRNTFIK